MRILNIEKKEARPIFLLISYSFFMGLSIAFYFTATISDFLVDFDISYMPYTYILSGILGYILWLIWSRLEQTVSFRNRLKAGIGFLFITVATLGFSSFYIDNKWISFIMLVWVRVFIFVNMVNFWGIAGRLFNISQGKRLFGIISIGSVISDLIGFFSIPVILFLGVNNSGLLIIALGALVICLLITVRITRIFKAALGEDQTQNGLKRRTAKKEAFFKSKYHFNLFVLAILPMFGFYFVDYLFLDQIQLEFQNSSEAIANFMGIFFGVVALFELLVKTTVFSRLIYNFGVKITLLTMPVIIMLSVLLTISTGLLAGGIGFLFSMIAFIKLLEKVLRSGINDPSFQILYQPIPSAERLAFQSKMEGIPTALGNISAGILLLILIYFNLTNILIFNSIFLIVLIYWAYMAFKMHKEYREAIVNNLSGISASNSPNESDEQESHITPMAEILNTKESIQHLLSGQFIDLEGTINKIALGLTGLSDELKLILRQFINKYQLWNYPALSQIAEEFGFDNQIEHISFAADVDPENRDHLINKYLQSDESETKLKAIPLISNAKVEDLNFQDLYILLTDENPAVVNGALQLVPVPIEEKYAEFLVETMENMPLSHMAVPLFNNKNKRTEKLIIKKLQQLESSQWFDLNSQLLSLQFIQIQSQIGGEEAQKQLIKFLDFSSSEIRYFSAKALDKLAFKASKEDEMYFFQLLEKEVAFCAWILATIVDLEDANSEMHDLIQCLQKEYQRVLDQIFIYLGFIYPKETIHQIHTNLRSESTEKNVLGIEMCEMLFSETIRLILIPLLINAPANERLRLLNKDFPQQNLTVDQRLANISYYNFSRVNTWLKISAMTLLSERIHFVPREMTANTFSANSTIKQSAYLAIYAIDKNEYLKRIGHELQDYRATLEKIIHQKNSIYQTVIKLKKFSLFENVHETILIKLALTSFDLEVENDQILSNQYTFSSYVHFLYSGSISVRAYAQSASILFEEGDIIGLFAPCNLREIDFSSTEGTKMLVMEAGLLFRLAAIYERLGIQIKDQANKLCPAEDCYFYTN